MNTVEVIFTLQRDFKQGWGLDQALAKLSLTRDKLPELINAYPRLADELLKRFNYVSRETSENNTLKTQGTENAKTDMGKGTKRKPSRATKGSA